MRRSVNDNFDDDDNLEAYDGDDQEHNDRDYWRGMSPPPRYSTPDATPRQPTSTPPALDRYMRQPPSTRGKVVYVLFGGSQPGVWYNWTALVYHREHAYPPGQQPTNRGYRSYWAAHAAYGEFCRTGLVPASEESGWTPPPEPPNWNPPPPPHEASRPPSTPSRLTRPAGSAPPISPSTPRGSTISSPRSVGGTPSRVSSSRRGGNVGPPSSSITASSLAVRRDGHYGSSLTTASLLSSSSGQLWFVVSEGLHPGVYASQASAMSGRGGTEGLVVFLTEAEADHFFVREFMDGRVFKIT